MLSKYIQNITKIFIVLEYMNLNSPVYILEFDKYILKYINKIYHINRTKLKRKRILIVASNCSLQYTTENNITTVRKSHPNNISITSFKLSIH